MLRSHIEGNVEGSCACIYDLSCKLVLFVLSALMQSVEVQCLARRSAIARIAWRAPGRAVLQLWSAGTSWSTSLMTCSG